MIKADPWGSSGFVPVGDWADSKEVVYDQRHGRRVAAKLTRIAARRAKKQARKKGGK